MPAARAPMPAPAQIETPSMRRSAALAQALQDLRKAPAQIGGYGDLGARLLAQGITKWSGERAEKAAREEGAARVQSQSDALNLQLAALLGGNQPQPETMGAAPPPPMVAPVQNTQQPVEAMSAPLPPVDGAPMPPAAPAVAPVAPPAPMPMADAPAVPQAPPPASVAPQAPPVAPARNPLGITPGEETLIRRALSSGDAGQIAWAQGVLGEIEGRMSAPPEWKDVSVNGVPYLRDQFGNMREAFVDGIPQSALTRDEFNPEGLRPGTVGQRDPFNRLSIIDEPPEGFESSSTGLRPVRGGPSDPAAGGNRIQNERELRREFGNLTQEYRTVRQAFQKVEASLAQGTGIGDVGGIFGVMKVFDPGSTVREGEAATVQNSGGVPETIRGLYNRVVTGERLTPAQRAEIVAVGRAQFGTYEQGYQSRVADFTRMADDYGIDPRNIVGGDEAPAPRPQPRPRPAAPNRPRQPAPTQNRPALPPGFVWDQ